ncbi:hypothetical protein [Bifidobacterium catulorum]|uniref:hypothetical protein n=1 Tax=Bifidobacterium catulorum TaxID=1630173 RepID=UPI0011B296EE|nr:hypothetical protein [Bifidobacterium catulorum]
MGCDPRLAVCLIADIDSPVRADDALADRIADAGDDAGTRDYYAMAAKRGDIDAEQQAYEELP